MTRLTVREFREEDFTSILLSPLEYEFRRGQDLKGWVYIHKHAGPSATLEAAGQIIACGGIHNYWPGVGEVWVTVSPLARDYPDILRAVRQLVWGWVMRYGYRRLQAAVEPEWPAAVRLVEHLGFEREGIMKRYGPNGRDMALYALIVE